MSWMVLRGGSALEVFGYLARVGWPPVVVVDALIMAARCARLDTYGMLVCRADAGLRGTCGRTIVDVLCEIRSSVPGRVWYVMASGALCRLRYLVAERSTFL